MIKTNSKGITMLNNRICSTCETDKFLKIKNITTDFKIKGDEIKYTYGVLVCTQCGEYISSPNQNDEILKGAYDRYKKIHGLLLTDEIISIRKNYNLSLRDFSKILGLSFITYHRYEKGAIPEPALNNLLLLIKENPQNLDNLFENSKLKFEPKKVQKIQNIINHIVNRYLNLKCADCAYQQLYEQNYLEEKAEMSLANPNPYRLTG
jgi:putative zinc finger/helix-turn-helix YgiT family protein